METVFERYLNKLIQNTIYGFILIEKFRDVRDENIKDTTTPYQPVYKILEFDNKILESDNETSGFYKPKNESDRLTSILLIGAFSEKEIGLTDETVSTKEGKILGICRKWNDTEYHRALQELSKWQNMIESDEARKRIKYFSDVLGELDVWYYDNKIILPNPIPIKEKFPVGFQPSHRKLTKKNYDAEIDKLIKFHLRFFKDENNRNKKIKYKLYARNLGKGSATITRRFRDDKFLKRIIERIELMLSKDFPNTLGGWNLSQTEQELLIILLKETETKRLSLSRKGIINESSKEMTSNQAKSKDGSEIPSQSTYKESTISDKASKRGEYGNEKENIFSALDVATELERRCNNCNKKYKVIITEDDDLEKWEKEAEKDHPLYRKLVCSDNCYEELLKQKGLSDNFLKH